MEAKTTRGLKVISNSNPVQMRQEMPDQNGAIQQSLFPLRSRRSVVFVSLLDMDHRDFVALLKNAAPAVVVELRRIPRFDIGPLNRHCVFDLFRQNGDVYLDLGTEQLNSHQQDVPSKVQKALQQHVKDAKPILFLTSSTQEPPSFSKSILQWLQGSNEPWEVYQVPHHGEKSIAEHIA